MNFILPSTNDKYVRILRHKIAKITSYTKFSLHQGSCYTKLHRSIIIHTDGRTDKPHLKAHFPNLTHNTLNNILLLKFINRKDINSHY